MAEFKYSDDQIKKYIDGIYAGTITEHKLPEDLYFAIADYLKSGLYSGFGGTLSDFSGKDLELLSELRENTYMFSAAKTYQQTFDQKKLLFDEEGNLRSSKEFTQLAEKNFDTWNDAWGRSEYSTAVGQGAMASQWQRIEENKDILPILTFDATGEECPICQPFEGLSAPVDDPVWDWATPLLHFNCFPKGTKILSENSWVNIETLKEGDLVIGGSGNLKHITAIHRNIIDDEIRHIAIKNKSCFATKNHSFLTVDGWKRAENINVGDILLQVNDKIGFNKSILCIYNFGSIFNYLCVSLKRKWKSFMMNAFDSNIKFRNININKAAIDQFISNRGKSHIFNEIKNYLLVLCKFFVIYSVSFGFFLKQFFDFLMRSIGNIFISHRIILFHTFRSVWSFASKKWMHMSLSVIGKQFALIIPSFWFINPLPPDAFRTRSTIYSKFIHNFKESSKIDIPFSANSIESFASVDIHGSEGFTGGAPLDGFNSKIHFLLYSFFHNKYNLVYSIANVQYKNEVCNISIEKDHSYITEIGIVHNCECVIKQGDEDTELSSKEDYDKVASLKDTVPEPFRMNPGKDKYIFSPDHPYFDVAKKDIPFAKENFGLPIPPVTEEVKTPITGLTLESAKQIMPDFKISAEEGDALKKYTGGKYNLINGYFRGIRKSISDENNETAKTLDSFLDRAPKVTTESYRGITLDEYKFEDFKKLEKGGKFTDSAFMSTSYDKTTATAFENNAQYQVEMIIKGKSGVLIEDFSDAKKEKEILFGREKAFRIESIKTTEKKGISGKIKMTLIEL